MFKTEQRGDVTVVVAGSELNAHNAPEAKTTLRGLVNSGRVKLIIDLSALSFIDSAGLGALLTAFKTAGAAGGQLVLCGLSQPVKSIFELTRLDRVFPIFDTQEEAVGSF
ncbi:MAG: STAS domain-containing protein [Acidobacteria bacterium]|nr:STAS domain-containing protein [Acidobacteriota bacterium]